MPKTQPLFLTNTKENIMNVYKAVGFLTLLLIIPGCSNDNKTEKTSPAKIDIVYGSQENDRIFKDYGRAIDYCANKNGLESIYHSYTFHPDIAIIVKCNNGQEHNFNYKLKGQS